MLQTIESAIFWIFKNLRLFQETLSIIVGDLTALSSAVFKGHEKMIILLALNGAKEYRPTNTKSRWLCESRVYRGPDGKPLIIGGCAKGTSKDILEFHEQQILKISSVSEGEVYIGRADEETATGWYQSASKEGFWQI